MALFTLIYDIDIYYILMALRQKHHNSFHFETGIVTGINRDDHSP